MRECLRGGGCAAIIVFIVCGAGACGSGAIKNQLPAWTAPAALTDVVAPVHLSGSWTVNAELSPDPHARISSAIEELRKKKRPDLNPPAGGSTGRRIKIKDDPIAPQDDVTEDSRLAALYAKTVLISQGGNRVAFSFDSAEPVTFLTGNQATSSDNNVNVVLADWEGSQFVVEKNGPRGLVLERWILSPDRTQLYLHVSVEIKMPDLPGPSEVVTIDRMFDRIK
ncbi:MAG TPA: hypothetical protein VGL10_05865 [Gammaproteobacteria bacterium]